jgi:hypothetical protein
MNKDKIIETVVDLHTFASILASKAHRGNDENRDGAFLAISAMVTEIFKGLGVKESEISRYLNDRFDEIIRKSMLELSDNNGDIDEPAKA